MTEDLSTIHHRPDLYDTGADAWVAAYEQAEREEDRARMMGIAFAVLACPFLAACVAAVGFAVGAW